MELKFRALRADEIDVRVSTVAKDNKGVSLLLYKDARCDMNILDETVGPMNWKKSYELIDGQLFCTIEIWDEDKKQWIGKQDVGVESNTEEVKGRASDAQKRSAFAFGIGRELYTAPFIWVNLDPTDENQNPKKVKFWVKEMVVENKKITALTVCWCNKWGEQTDQVAFRFPRGKAPAKAAPAKKAAGASPRPTEADDASLTPMRERVKSIYRGDILLELLNKYNVTSIDRLTKEQLETILKNYDEWQAKKKEARTA